MGSTYIKMGSTYIKKESTFLDKYKLLAGEAKRTQNGSKTNQKRIRNGSKTDDHQGKQKGDFMKKLTKLIGVVGIAIAGALAPANHARAASGDVTINSSNFPDKVFREYVKEFDLDKNGILSLAERKKVSKMKLRDRTLASVKGLEQFTEVTELEFYGDDLQYVDVSKNTQLKSLEIYGISQSTIDLSKNTNLKQLVLNCYADEGGLAKVDVSKNTNLEGLYVYSDAISSINLSNNTKLTSVSVNAPIQSIDISNLSQLKELSVYSHKLKSLDTGKNKKLYYLRVESNLIESLNLDNNSELHDLTIRSKSLKKLSMNNVKLSYLNLTGIQVESLDLSKHTGLSKIFCLDTSIKELKINSDGLDEAYLPGTQIKELDLRGCKRLREVYNNDSNGGNGNYTKGNWRLTIPSTCKVINNIVVTVVPSRKEWGSVKGGGTYTTGDRVTIKAIPADEYAFASFNYGEYWYSSGVYVSKELITTNTPYYFTPTEDVIIVAEFVKKMPFSVRVDYDKSVLKYGGLISLNISYDPSVTIPKIFYQWYRGDEKIKGATDKAYKPQKEDIGKNLSCEITTSLGGKKRLTVNGTIQKADGKEITSKISVQTPEWDGAYGAILGINSTMEYSTTKDFAKKKTCPSSKMKVKAGTYYIRYAETATTKAGTIKAVKVPKGTSAADTFTDLDNKAWYIEAVNFVYVKGIMNGISGSSFAPMNVSNRAEFVTMLYNLAGKPRVSKSAGFKDVKKGMWYENAVNWAYAAKITNGVTKTKFGPDQKVTRQQAATMLYNYAVYKKLDTTGSTKALDKFPDKKDVESWAKKPFEWAVYQGVVNGKVQGNKTMLAPKDKITRAECAQMIKNMVERVKTKK